MLKLPRIGEITAYVMEGKSFFHAKLGKTAIYFGTAFADECTRLSSDLQLLAKPRTPLVDTLVGFFLALTELFSCNTSHYSDNT